MTEPERTRLPGLDAACRALAAGQAAVVPNPSPMTYGVVATSPHAVNALKHRALDQNVAVSLHADADWRQVEPLLAVPPELLARIRVLLRSRLSVLAPLRDAAPYPAWAGPALRSGWLAMFSGRWAPLAPLWDRFPHLYGSSANRTGRRPAASALEAADIFGEDAPIVDGDAMRDLGSAHAASSMVRVAPNGELSLHRHGAQDSFSGLEPDAYVEHLATMAID